MRDVLPHARGARHVGETGVPFSGSGKCPSCGRGVVPIVAGVSGPLGGRRVL